MHTFELFWNIKLLKDRYIFISAFQPQNINVHDLDNHIPRKCVHVKRYQFFLLIFAPVHIFCLKWLTIETCIYSNEDNLKWSLRLLPCTDPVKVLCKNTADLAYM